MLHLAPAQEENTPTDAPKQRLESIDYDVALAKDEIKTVTCFSPHISGGLEKRDGTGTTIRVPVDLVTDLLSLVDNIKKDMSVMQRNIDVLRTQNRELNNNLTVTKADLRTLQRNSGAEFYLLPKMPLELQRLVWREALGVSRIIALQCYYEMDGVQLIATAKSRLPNPIREVCRIARLEALNIQTSTFSAVWPENEIGYLQNPSRYVLQSNPGADILWFFTWYDDQHWEGGDIYQIADRLTEMNSQPHTIAISFGQWAAHLRAKEIDRAMHDYARIQTQQLIIVLNFDPDDLSESTDVVFVEPILQAATSAFEYYADFFTWRRLQNETEEKLDWKDGDHPIVPWEQLEEEAIEYLELLKFKHAIAREQLVKAGISEDAIDGNIEYVNAWNCSTWTVTSIRFMDATTMAQLRQDTDLSLWTREELKTKIVPPQ